MSSKKFPRGAVKEFRQHLNKLDADQPKHRHGVYRQLSRPYGDYLYAQDREKFYWDLQNWLDAGKPAN